MKKKIVMICTAAIVFTLVGCSGSKNVDSTAEAVISSEDAESAESSSGKQESAEDSKKAEDAKSDQNDETLIDSDKSDMALGQITSIDGDTVTLTLGEMSLGEAPSGEAPSGEAPSGEAPSGEAPSGEAPSGERPSGGGPGKGGESEVPFTASDETLSITFDGTITIQIMENGQMTEGTIEDLALDDILSIAYDDDGTVISVQVMNQAEETETES
ncbi:MAG: hypothetical protein PHT89_02610 [Lachnospiraceae bacterium]|nr:hypothetical protein [Lachnospiraceae bacterium]